MGTLIQWLRKVSALETAIDIYMEKGYLHNDKQITLGSGPAFCTTGYGTLSSTLSESSLKWDDISLYPVDLQFDMVRGDMFQSDDETLD